RTPALLRRFRREAQELGLELFVLNVIGLDWFRPLGTEDELAATLRQLKVDIDSAVALGVGDVMIWEGVRPEPAGRPVLEQHCLPRDDPARAVRLADAGARGRHRHPVPEGSHQPAGIDPDWGRDLISGLLSARGGVRDGAVSTVDLTRGGSIVRAA